MVPAPAVALIAATYLYGAHQLSQPFADAGTIPVSVVQGNNVSAARWEPGAYGQVTARAMDTLAGILAVGGHLLADDGRLLAMKGQRPDAEIAALPPGWRVETVQRLQVPGVEGDRHLVVVTRDRPQTA